MNEGVEGYVHAERRALWTSVVEWAIREHQTADAAVWMADTAIRGFDRHFLPGVVRIDSDLTASQVQEMRGG